MRINSGYADYYAAYRTHPQRVEDYSKRNFTKEITDSALRVEQIEAETAAYRVELGVRPIQLHDDSTES